MLHLRAPYTPPIFIHPRRVQALVSVGAASSDSGVEYEAVPESPKHLSPLRVGAAGMQPLSPIEKIVGGAYLALFLAGPPVIGWLAFGTLGAVAGTVLAAPAIYWVGSALIQG